MTASTDVGVKVVKRGKWYVDVTYEGLPYRINCWLVWCTGSPQGNRTFWQVATRTNLGFSQMREIASELSTGGQWVSSEYRRCFDVPPTGDCHAHRTEG